MNSYTFFIRDAAKITGICRFLSEHDRHYPFTFVNKK
jgi:hypothetical protein